LALRAWGYPISKLRVCGSSWAMYGVVLSKRVKSFAGTP